MDKEKEIEEMEMIMLSNLDRYPSGTTINSRDLMHGFAKDLFGAGYGNVKQAVKEFVETALKEFESIEEHCLDMHNWQGQSAVCECTDRLKDKFKELYGEGDNES